MRWTKKLSKYYELEKAAYNEKVARFKEIKKKNKEKTNGQTGKADID